MTIFTITEASTDAYTDTLLNTATVRAFTTEEEATKGIQETLEILMDKVSSDDEKAYEINDHSATTEDKDFYEYQDNNSNNGETTSYIINETELKGEL